MKLKPCMIFILPIFMLYSQTSHAQKISRVREFQTPRLMASGGAGVAAVLLEESAVLNPAGITFYSNSSVLMQGGKAEFNDGSTMRGVGGPVLGDANAKSIIISDTTGGAKGLMSYQSQREFDAQRRRFTLTAAGLVGDSSSLGFLYRYNREKTNMSNSDVENKYHQLVIGVTHIISDNFTMGAIIVDPFKSIEEDGKVVLGFQFIIHRMLFFMFDAGANIHETLSETAVYKGALQMNFFSSFFMRFGVFNDKSNGTKGNGWGVSWIGPKLSIDMATKTTKAIDNLSALLYEDETLKETSLSISVRF